MQITIHCYSVQQMHMCGCYSHKLQAARILGYKPFFLSTSRGC